MKTIILKEIDKLEHDKENGFYDKELDMYFDTLEQWLMFKYGKTWGEII